MNQSPRAERPLSSHVLQWFVDRYDTLNQFAAALDRGSAALLTVEGPTGIGKTWFLERLWQEVERHGRPATNLDLRWAGSVDDAWMVDRLAQGLGQEQFPTLNDTLERGVKLEVVFRIEGGGGNVNIQDSQVNAPVAGGSIVQGNTFYLKTQDKKLRESWLSLLDDAFFTDLALLGKSRGAVLLFDETEHICPHGSAAAAPQASGAAATGGTTATPEGPGPFEPPEACLWLVSQLLWRMANGLLDGVKVEIGRAHV